MPQGYFEVTTYEDERKVAIKALDVCAVEQRPVGVVIHIHGAQWFYVKDKYETILHKVAEIAGLWF